MKTLISLFIILLTAQPTAAGTPFIFAYESEEIFPFYMGTTQIPKKNPGVSIELIQLLGRQLSLDVKFTRHSWKRLLLSLKAGKVDALVASYKPSRLEFGNYPMKDGQVDQKRCIAHSNYSLYVTKGSYVTWNPESVRISGADKDIGAPFGYSVVALLKQARVRVDEYGNTRENLIKLKADRIDGAALLEFDADRIIFHEKSIFPNVIKLEPFLSSKPYYIMLSARFLKTYPGLGEQIWDACGDIRETHRPTILKRYLQSAYK